MPAVTTIQLRKGTALAWTTANPTLASGEIGYETDTGKRKIGDGATAWTSLGYTDAPYAHLAGTETITGAKTHSGALTVSDKTSATNVALRAASGDQIIHVSLSGNDSNDGLSPGSAKATVAGALTALGSTPGTIRLGYGTYNITSTDSNGNGVTLNQIGTVLEGAGNQLTILNINVNATWGVKANAGHCEVRNLTVQIATGKTVTYGCGVSCASSGTAEFCKFRSVYVQVEGTCTAMFAVGPDVSADIAQTRFDDCQAAIVTGTATHGWLLGNAAIVDTLMTIMVNCGVTAATNGITIDGCGCTWVGGGGTDCTTDINVLAYGGDGIQFYGYRGENGTQAVVSSGFSASGPGLLLDSCFFGNYTGPSSDGIIIAWNGAAPLIIRGGFYTTVGNITSITLNPFGGQFNSLTAIGVTSDTPNPFPAVNTAKYLRTITNFSYLPSGSGAPIWPAGLQNVQDGAPPPRQGQIPSSLHYESWPRAGSPLSAQAINATGEMALSQIWLPVGAVVSDLCCMFSAVGATQTHLWLALYDPSLNLLGYTADKTSTLPTVNVLTSFAVAKNAAGSTVTSVTTAVSGYHYVAVMQAASTIGTLYGVASEANILTPLISGLDTTHTGLTTTPPATATLAAGLTRMFYVGTA